MLARPAALDAGKAVYCEAPLGRTLAEADEMANLVGSRHTAIGLQGRLNPAVRRAGHLLSSGKIGRPLTADRDSLAGHKTGRHRRAQLP